MDVVETIMARQREEAVVSNLIKTEMDKIKERQMRIIVMVA